MDNELIKVAEAIAFALQPLHVDGIGEIFADIANVDSEEAIIELTREDGDTYTIYIRSN